jgi:hypothetical protein
MSTPAQLRVISQPQNFRSGINNGGSQIPRYRLVSKDLTGVDRIQLATAATQVPAGVTDIEIDPGASESYQRFGKVKVLTGAAFGIGDRIITDSTGRAIVGATPATDRYFGTAVTASTGPNDYAEVELAIYP